MKWLVQLEKWADAHADLKDTKSVLPKENYDKWLKEKRGSFPRIASFVCVHNTEFSRQISNYFTDNLPVPSHDTYTWYMALRLGKKIKPVKMKRWFSPKGWEDPSIKIVNEDPIYSRRFHQRQSKNVTMFEEMAKICLTLGNFKNVIDIGS